MKFPEFLSSKLFTLKPDTVDIPLEMNKPVYDLIIGADTMAKMSIVMDFSKCKITIDHNVLPMKKVKKSFGFQSFKQFSQRSFRANQLGKQYHTYY